MIGNFKLANCRLLAVLACVSASVILAHNPTLANENSADQEAEISSAVLRTAIVVADADRSKQFYIQVFGFTAGFDGDISKPVNRELLGLSQEEVARFVILRGRSDVAGFEVSTNAIGLLEISGSAPRIAVPLPGGNGLGPGQTMFAVVTDDIQSVIARLHELDAPLVAGPVIANDGSEIEIVTRDPDGMRIHVVQRLVVP